MKLTFNQRMIVTLRYYKTIAPLSPMLEAIYRECLEREKEEGK